jgi:hypothetical protein
MRIEYINQYEHCVLHPELIPKIQQSSLTMFFPPFERKKTDIRAESRATSRDCGGLERK